MKLFFKMLLWVLAFVTVIYISIIIFVEPWLAKKIEVALNEKNKEYIITIEEIDILFVSSGIELKGITLKSKKQSGLTGKLKFIKILGVKLKALYNNDIDIREIYISEGSLSGNLSSPEEIKTISEQEKIPNLAPANIQIGRLFFNQLNLTIADTASALTYSIKDAIIEIFDIRIKSQDTLSVNSLHKFNFEARELALVSSDSLHTFNAQDINYSDSTNILEIISFSIHPNYTNHVFTSRFKYETDRIEATGNNICILGFSAATYLKSGNILSTYVEIEKLDMKVFRDKRKKFKHVNKPTFQDLMYNYPHFLHIDSIGLIKGNVTYTEHVEGANDAGYISFSNIHASIYNITNNTLYKTEKGFLELKSDAFLMGKSKVNVLLKAELYEPENTFSLTGNMAAMEASGLNTILEKNAFMYVTNGKIDALNFSFEANNTQSSGVLTALYHDLNITVKNKRTDDTTSLKDRITSVIANTVILNSNPMPNQEVRHGKIEYERDPEKFLFHYCAKSILSGIRNSITNVKSKAEKQAIKAARAEKKADRKAEKELNNK